ncbi:hypothetical protein ACWD6R_38735 [Streptomyces sp. NPDC005151]
MPRRFAEAAFVGELAEDTWELRELVALGPDEPDYVVGTAQPGIEAGRRNGMRRLTG